MAASNPLLPVTQIVGPDGQIVTLGGGSGGATTVADGGDAALGSTADAPYSDTTGAAPGSAIALLKGQYVMQRVVGSVASGTADSGNPVKVGGVYNSTQPTFTSGQRGDFQTSARGEQLVKLSSDGTGLAARADNADNMASGSSTSFLGVLARQTVYDGTQWQRARGDTNGAFSVGKGGSNIATGQIAVTTSATLVVAARTGRQKVTLSPTSSTVYYVGATGVSATTGVYVAAGSSITLDTAAAVYAVGAAAVTISYVEFY